MCVFQSKMWNCLQRVKLFTIQQMTCLTRNLISLKTDKRASFMPMKGNFIEYNID